MNHFEVCFDSINTIRGDQLVCSRDKNKTNHWSKPIVLLSALVLTACGGGGGGGASAPAAPTPTPVARACPPVTSPGDPLYSDQWHLKNTGSTAGSVVGEDANVESVWSFRCGRGITIAVVDDGLQIAHEDLAANILQGSSHNYVTNTNDPSPVAGSTDAHGTSVAGIAAAVGFNDIGVRGVAPGAQLVGYNLLQALDSINEADAMTRGAVSTVDISNNSWGNTPDTGGLGPSTVPWRAAIDTGITSGRGGKGVNYFWAGGNGLGNGDQSNFDGQANYHGVNAVAALDDAGKQASYSEGGANILISAPAGEFCASAPSDPITTANNVSTTTDLMGADGANNAGAQVNTPPNPNVPGVDYANDNYTQCFNGTSSATPVVAGVAALVLEVNPNLTRRDMRLLLATTARKNDPSNTDWGENGAGHAVNIRYGYGAVDAAAAVAAAATWTLLAPEKTPEPYTSALSAPIAIPDTTTNGTGGTEATNTITVSSSAITRLEFVDINFTSDHTYWGDLLIKITSPMGTESILKIAHESSNADGTPNDLASGARLATGFRFGSVRHFNESPVGDWMITVQDFATGDEGNINSWSIKLYGR
jgi:kexin